MIHFSCDRCKKPLDKDELRYVLRLEVGAVLEPLDGEEPEDDRDHLLELDEILERSLDEASDAVGPDIYQRQRHDLCRSCYEKFIRNPLGSELPQFEFSDN